MTLPFFFFAFWGVEGLDEDQFCDGHYFAQSAPVPSLHLEVINATRLDLCLPTEARCHPGTKQIARLSPSIVVVEKTAREPYQALMGIAFQQP